MWQQLREGRLNEKWSRCSYKLRDLGNLARALRHSFLSWWICTSAVADSGLDCLSFECVDVRRHWPCMSQPSIVWVPGRKRIPHYVQRQDNADGGLLMWGYRQRRTVGISSSFSCLTGYNLLSPAAELLFFWLPCPCIKETEMSTTKTPKCAPCPCTGGHLLADLLVVCQWNTGSTKGVFKVTCVCPAGFIERKRSLLWVEKKENVTRLTGRDPDLE